MVQLRLSGEMQYEKEFKFDKVDYCVELKLNCVGNLSGNQCEL